MAQGEPVNEAATDHRAPLLGDIIGQDRAMGTLRSAIASGRVHHAWVFSGPEGVGKRTAAEAFAGALLDPTTAPNLAGEVEPDPESETQAMLSRGAHPDLHIITKELARYSADPNTRNRKLTNIPLEVVKEFITGVAHMAPMRWTDARINKAIIVDEAELLSDDGQDTMLKTLEEPPAKTLLILITSAEQRLRETIRSRCQRAAFGPLDDVSMREWIDRAGLALDTEETDWLIEHCDGSPGRLLDALASGLHDWARRLEPLLQRADRGEYDAQLGSTMLELVDGWAEAHVKANPNASKRAANDDAALKALGLVVHRARRRLRERVDQPGEADRAERVIDAVESARDRIRSNVSLGLALEGLAAELVS